VKSLITLFPYEPHKSYLFALVKDGSSQIVSHFVSNLPKNVPNHYPKKKDAHDSDLAHSLGGLSQSQKLSENKPL
jgi:hypothetical protein